MGFEQKLNELQRHYMDDDATKSDRKNIHESWFHEDTVDYWRHKRMYSTIKPFAESKKGATWLTIGDGRYGLDSVRLKRLFGLTDVFPTDIAGNMLRLSSEKGIISKYSVENAEALSFADNAFDVIFCKEAFHHFPRPYLALYEMIRVSAEAVILIEPAERLQPAIVNTQSYIKSALQLLTSKVFRRSYLPYLPEMNELQHAYEEAGNYLYAVSIRELEKLTHGIGLADMAFKQFNDIYLKGCEFEKANESNSMFQRLRNEISSADRLCISRPDYHRPNMVSVILFKKAVDQTVKADMIKDGFTFIRKVSNPNLG